VAALLASRIARNRGLNEDVNFRLPDPAVFRLSILFRLTNQFYRSKLLPSMTFGTQIEHIMPFAP
jgi:hypothetical protein